MHCQRRGCGNLERIEIQCCSQLSHQTRCNFVVRSLRTAYPALKLLYVQWATACSTAITTRFASGDFINTTWAYRVHARQGR